MNCDGELLYKLWLNIMCKHNPELIHKHIEKYGSAKEIYDMRGKTANMNMMLNRVFTSSRAIDSARALFEQCKEEGIEIITIDDKRYPKRLAQIYCPPQILYVKGEMPDFDNYVCITIAGSRDCSDYSRMFANSLSRDLAKSGVLIISGMALGVDAASHIGALEEGSITVAVLAGGVDVVYPKANNDLYTRICKRGAIISEQPPGTIGRRNFYSQRNRIMVGLSNGVVITEGRERSGTKITANWANDSNRDVFAVPGKPCDKGAELPNRLIKDSAKLITTAEDVLEEYISVYPIEIENGLRLINRDMIPDRVKESGIDKLICAGRVVEMPKPEKPDFGKFDEKQRIILEYLYNNKGTVHIDDLSRECNIETTELSFLIIQLLMERAVKEYPGEYYGLYNG